MILKKHTTDIVSVSLNFQKSYKHNYQTEKALINSCNVIIFYITTKFKWYLTNIYFNHVETKNMEVFLTIFKILNCLLTSKVSKFGVCYFSLSGHFTCIHRLLSHLRVSFSPQLIYSHSFCDNMMEHNGSKLGMQRQI